MEPDRRPHVVIVGAGFAGLEAAKIMGRRDDVRLTLVDRRNHHLFQPLVYQVATAALDPSDVAAPIRGILRRARNTDVMLAEVTAIDRAGRTVQLADGASVDYDHLIVAAGAQDNYFGHADWAEYAPGMKSIEDALEVRGRVLFAFEGAEREEDEARRRSWLTFVVIGGGPTGVELAGSLSEMAHRALPATSVTSTPTRRASSSSRAWTGCSLPTRAPERPERSRSWRSCRSRSGWGRG
jgi:NADH dehydrogenase